MYHRQFVQRGCEGLMKFYIWNPEGNKHEENNSLPYIALDYIIFQNLLWQVIWLSAKTMYLNRIFGIIKNLKQL